MRGTKLDSVLPLLFRDRRENLEAPLAMKNKCCVYCQPVREPGFRAAQRRGEISTGTILTWILRARELKGAQQLEH